VLGLQIEAPICARDAGASTCTSCDFHSEVVQIVGEPTKAFGDFRSET
jgi:hypothetical protein